MQYFTPNPRYKTNNKPLVKGVVLRMLLSSVNENGYRLYCAKSSHQKYDFLHKWVFPSTSCRSSFKRYSNLKRLDRESFRDDSDKNRTHISQCQIIKKGRTGVCASKMWITFNSATSFFFKVVPDCC